MAVLETSPRPSRTTPVILTAASAVAALALAAVGSGAFGGTPVASAAGGYFSSTATPVAPGAPAFAIWSVIYAGLLAYAVWQLLPEARHSARQRRIRPWAAASMLLNAAWLWASSAPSPRALWSCWPSLGCCAGSSRSAWPSAQPRVPRRS